MNLPNKDITREEVDPLDATEHALDDEKFPAEAMLATAALPLSLKVGKAKTLALPPPSWLGHGKTDMHPRGYMNLYPRTENLRTLCLALGRRLCASSP